MNNKLILFVIALGVVFLFLRAITPQGYTASNAARATAEPIARASATATQIPGDSAAVKEREAQYFANHTYASATVDETNDHALTVRIDGNLWDAWGSQDRELHKRGYYNAWVSAYAANHPKKWKHYAPFSVRVVDLTGAQLAVEE